MANAISNTSNPSGTNLQIAQKEWSTSSLSSAGASSLHLDLGVIDRLSGEIEKEIHPKTTPFDKKSAKYRLVNKINWGRRTQPPWWKLFHVYVKGSIKPTDHE